MQAIKNFDENVYIVQDENGKYYIKINGKTMTKQEAYFLAYDINRAIDFIELTEKIK